MNLVELVARSVAVAPEDPAIVFEERRISYRDLWRSVTVLARSLTREHGVAAGDRVGIWFENTPEFVIAYLATLHVGAVAVSISPALKPAEVEYVIADSAPILVLTNRERLESVGRLGCPLAGVLDSGRATPSERSMPLAVTPRGTSDPASILYTSGTTGRPKGVVLTHGNLVTNTAAVQKCVGAHPGSKHLLFLPLFHCFGQNFILNTALRTGGTVVLFRRFEAAKVLLAVQTEQITHFYAVPTVYLNLLDLPEALRMLGPVRYFFSAAAPMPLEVALRFRTTFGQNINEGYGLTETSPLASYNHPTQYRPGSVGVPIDGVEMKVIDATGRSCGPMEQGEICIKGPNVMAGYYGRGEDTAAVLADGWLRSGDVGYRDQDGYYFLVDRIKDMINRAGFKVWPSEVEEVLYQHPAVKECAVVGVPDPRLGERVCAYVTPHAGLAVTQEELDEHCRALLANYKLPEAYVLDAVIPRNPAGKVLKRMLRESNSGEHP